MPLGLSPRETTIAEDQFRNAPSAVIPEATGGEIAMENISTPFNAALGGVAGTYAAVRSLGSNFGALGGYDPETSSVVEQEPEAVQRKFALDSAAIANQYAPDPRKSGAGAQFVYNIGSGAVKMIGDTLVTGSPIAGAAMFGATEGINTRNEIYAATGDKETADKLAIGSALFSGVAALLPGGYGETFAARIASGAVANTTFGVLQRDMMHTGLQDAGYTDMAKQYVPLDGAAMMADGILGTVFGGVHHMFAPEITDSARAIKDAEHAERSSPGIPSDPVSRQNGLDNLDRTISSMIHGDDPPPVGDVNFVPDPKQDAARSEAAKEVQSAKDEAIGKQEEVPVGFDMTYGPLGRFDSLIYHETEPYYAKALVPESGVSYSVPELFMANRPEYAIGQGENTGVKITFDASKLSGRLSDLKPGAEAQHAMGYREFIVGDKQKNFREAVQKVEVSPKVDRESTDYLVMKRALLHAGFKHEESGGTETFTKQQKEASSLGRSERAAKEEAAQASKLDPETQEALTQAHAAIKANPDLQVAGEDGKPVSAVDELNKALDDLKNSDGDKELHEVALACAGRA